MLIRNLVMSAGAVISLLYVTMLVRMVGHFTAKKATGLGAIDRDLYFTLHSPAFWIVAAFLILVSLFLTGGLLPLLPRG
jgi:hypothetical protein